MKGRRVVCPTCLREIASEAAYRRHRKELHPLPRDNRRNPMREDD